jgi:hypothetical protein
MHEQLPLFACPLSFQLCAKLLDFPLEIVTRGFAANDSISAAQPIP